MIFSIMFLLSCIGDDELEVCGLLETEVAEQKVSIEKLTAALAESQVANYALGHLVTDVIGNVEYEGGWSLHDPCSGQAIVKNGRIYRLSWNGELVREQKVMTFELEVDGTVSYVGKEKLPTGIADAITRCEADTPPL